MSFMLYKCVRRNSTTFTYERLRKVTLGGKSGPIASYVCDACKHTSTVPLSWHMSEPEILERLGEKEPVKQAFIIDLKPKVKGNVSLYQLKDIWGFSYPQWTPIALRLETLRVDEELKNPDEFKQNFQPLPLNKREYVYEFLYLRHGTKGGIWNWGPVGSVNGALLWPEAWKYFVDELSKTLESNSKAI